MSYNFKTVKPIPASSEMINIVLSKTQRKTPTVVHPGYAISRIRSFYMRKVTLQPYRSNSAKTPSTRNYWTSLIISQKYRTSILSMETCSMFCMIRTISSWPWDMWRQQKIWYKTWLEIIWSWSSMQIRSIDANRSKEQPWVASAPWSEK